MWQVQTNEKSKPDQILQTELIQPDNLLRAAELLKRGKLVAFPTDTYFALGAAMSEPAVQSLFVAKGRNEGNPVPVLLASVDQLAQITDAALSSEQRKLTDRYWPGALTLVLPAGPSVPETVTAGTGTVGVRVPDHKMARQLIRLADSPLTGTSANRSGESPCKTAAEVMEQLNGRIAGVVNAPCGIQSAASTVVHLDGSRLTVLREGSISVAEIERVLESA